MTRPQYHHPSIDRIEVGSYVARRELGDVPGPLVGRVDSLRLWGGARGAILSWPCLYFPGHPDGEYQPDGRRGQSAYLTGLVVVDRAAMTPPVLAFAETPGQGPRRPRLLHVHEVGDGPICPGGGIAGDALCHDDLSTARRWGGAFGVDIVREHLAVWRDADLRICLRCAQRVLLVMEACAPVDAGS